MFFFCDCPEILYEEIQTDCPFLKVPKNQRFDNYRVQGNQEKIFTMRFPGLCIGKDKDDNQKQE